jgi:hypothetical protein
MRGGSGESKAQSMLHSVQVVNIIQDLNPAYNQVKKVGGQN